jgi:hypothetical protein
MNPVQKAETMVAELSDKPGIALLTKMTLEQILENVRNGHGLRDPETQYIEDLWKIRQKKRV